MKTFINDNFLIYNSTGQQLFNAVVSKLPVIDYHNHLNPQLLGSNTRFENITQLWVSGDPYKHRAMRINGIDEKFITGDASDKDKFLKWAETLPNTVGNPLFHWSCLELKRIFNIDTLLTESTADEIWTECNAQLKSRDLSIVDILKEFQLESACTSDDLLDDLASHQLATNSERKFFIYPSLRSDSIVNTDFKSFSEWVKKLSQLTDISIASSASYKEAIVKRLDYFQSSGCRLSDHALDAGFVFKLPSQQEGDTLLDQYLAGVALTHDDLVLLRSHLLCFLGKEYGKRNWAMQLHVGAQRYTSSRLRTITGPAGGYATIGSASHVASICSFLDSLEKAEYLPKTILYTLNPSDNAAFATLTGSFVGSGIKGKVQFGPAWWYNDHLMGMEDQLNNLASYGLLSHFIGMTTDSRSAMSFSRHEYFRRLLCNMLGAWAEGGKIPSDKAFMENLAKNICYYNIKNWITLNNE